uniref:Uncharacterized protein n=1 Tax=Spongospora subterranea TaxID=70186 RepID=A0A0H5R9I9_9EUKA|eukprot:CRZ05094.1 hypothetical protein [Spongospora subterranea]
MSQKLILWMSKSSDHQNGAYLHKVDISSARRSAPIFHNDSWTHNIAATLHLFHRNYSNMTCNRLRLMPEGMMASSDDDLPLTRPVPLTAISLAESTYLQRTRDGQVNVRILVGRDINIRSWIQTNANNPLQHVFAEAEFLNGPILNDSTIGDLFVVKVQTPAHCGLVKQLYQQLAHFAGRHRSRLEVLVGVDLIELGRIVRPDAVLNLIDNSNHTPRIIFEIEIQNRTPTHLHDHFLKHFDSFLHVHVVLALNFYRRPTERNGRKPGLTGLAAVYRRHRDGHVEVREFVDFGDEPMDLDMIQDLPEMLAFAYRRESAGRLQNELFYGTVVIRNEDVFGSVGSPNDDPLEINLAGMYSQLQDATATESSLF